MNDYARKKSKQSTQSNFSYAVVECLLRNVKKGPAEAQKDKEQPEVVPYKG